MVVTLSLVNRFSMDSVDSNLRTGSDLWQLASTFPDCKSVENRSKNRVIYSSHERL